MERMRRSRQWLSLVVVLFSVVSCEPLASGPRGVPKPGSGSGPSPGRAAIGRVRVDVNGVFVNNGPVSGTVSLFIGDDVRTDNTGQATIFFDAGGSLVLVPNTDPQLQLVSEVGCVGTAVLQVLIRRGTFDFFNVNRVCFCDPQDLVCGVPASDFRVVITTSGGASITVSRGELRVTVGRPPQQRKYRVVHDQGMVVQKGRTSGPQPIIK